MESRDLTEEEARELLARYAVDPLTSPKSAAYRALQEIALSKAVPAVAEILETGTDAERLRAASIAFKYAFGSKVEVYVENASLASSIGAAVSRSGLHNDAAHRLFRELLADVQESQ